MQTEQAPYWVNVYDNGTGCPHWLSGHRSSSAVQADRMAGKTKARRLYRIKVTPKPRAVAP